MAIRFVCVETDEVLRVLTNSTGFFLIDGPESLREASYGPSIRGRLDGFLGSPREVLLKRGNGTPPTETLVVRFTEEVRLHGILDVCASEGYILSLPAEKEPRKMLQGIANALSMLDGQVG